MAVFKVVVNNPKTRKTFQKDIDQSNAIGLVGKKIGDEFNGDLIGFSGYTLQVTGGTDKDGFPMHPDLKGAVRRKLLLKGLPGFKSKTKGQRRRKMVCGNTIGNSIVQINVKVVKEGSKTFDEISGKTAEDGKVGTENKTKKDGGE